ncbi:hypothetical protein DLJ49_00925 [Rhodovulum sp. 12E13]|nr:DUF6476 family protein [Rhodovulum sp. 12E13]RDC75495.1 hypothetical protein DLJ49_00925 [Rhodovulum sp. 12E13]
MRGLRLLRGLVTVLTATMIAGIAAIVVLLYLRLPGGATASAPPAPAPLPAQLPALPGSITLPEGARAQAVTAGPGWWAVVTRAGDILLYDAEGTLLRRIAAEELAAD